MSSIPHLVVVDDDASYRELTVLALEDVAGDLPLVEFDGARKALASIGEEACPATFVVDFHMPSMSGAELCAALRARGCRSTVVILSSRLSPAEVHCCLAAGADSVLAKPAGLPQLRQALRQALGR